MLQSCVVNAIVATRVACVLVLALLVPTPHAAQTGRMPLDVSKLGPQVGERVPDFMLTDQNGKSWTLRSIMGPKGAMLVFFRSADW
jgi:cytochrome oxidase Cu insertion factor (SCO1/SenC/PrrC family)